MITVCGLFFITAVWGQFVVKNTSGDVVLSVDSQASVVVGSAAQDGDLTTHTITILQGAANGLVLKSDASGQASWSTDLVNDADHNIGNEYQDLNLSGNTLSITDGNSVTLPAGSDNQQLSINDHTISLERGGSVVVPDNVNDADHVIGNEYQNLNEVLIEGNSAGNQSAVDFRRIGVGVSNPDSRIRVEGHAASTLPVVGTYNTSIYAKDLSSGDDERQVVIEGIGTAMSSDENSAHLGVQGFLVGGPDNDQWIASASLGYHNTNSGNQLSGVSSNVKDVGSYVFSTDLKTAAFNGQNDNQGSNHYGLHVSADKHYLNGNLLVDGKVGINIGDREPATWLEIYGQPYISAPNAGIVLKSSDGQCWQMRVNNSGGLFTTAITCP